MKCRLLLIPLLLGLVACTKNESTNNDSSSSIISESISESEQETSEDLYLEKPEDTNLEFWITQRVTSKDMADKGCTYLPGWFGAEEYLDSRYDAIKDGTMDAAPEVHVTYLLTGYPDLLDYPAITQIEITDPAITVYGLTINSTEREIGERLKDLATAISYVTTLDECYVCITIKNCSFSFMTNKITITVPVTNNSGIVY